MVQGAFAGFLVRLWAVVCGVLLGWNVGKIVAFFEDLFGVHLINSQVYFIDYLPSDVNLKDVAVIACISLGLGIYRHTVSELACCKNPTCGGFAL